MPYYRFQVDSPLPPKTIAARIHAITRESRGLLEYFRRGRPTNPPGPGFLGRVKDLSFRLQRDIRYSNSFLPVIRGRIVPDIVGSKMIVTMYLHPAAAVFMTFWLSERTLVYFLAFFRTTAGLLRRISSASAFISVRSRCISLQPYHSA